MGCNCKNKKNVETSNKTENAQTSTENQINEGPKTLDTGTVVFNNGMFVPNKSTLKVFASSDMIKNNN